MSDSIPEDTKLVRLAHGGREQNWWTVRAQDDRYVILTRQAPFRPAGEVEYTVIDWERGVRGPCNLIGQGWHATMPDGECEHLLRALNGLDDDGHPQVEVSHRNNVPIQILRISGANR